MNSKSDMGHEKSGHADMGNHYRSLGIMAALSLVAMYFLMFAMVDRLDNVIMNSNQVYMAVLMAAPMVLIELVLMKRMYTNTKLNAIIAGAAVLLGVLAFYAIRQQAAVGDRQFARAMIPHHASAILMCRQASIGDALIRTLCENPQGIVASQEREIEQLKAFLDKRD